MTRMTSLKVLHAVEVAIPNKSHAVEVAIPNHPLLQMNNCGLIDKV